MFVIHFCLIPRLYPNKMHGGFQLTHCKQLFVLVELTVVVCKFFLAFTSTPTSVNHIFFKDYLLIHISEFIITPTSVNATLGSTATFTCSASRGSITWIVNGSTLQELNRTDIRVSPTGTSLYIPATEAYNNTNVLCSVAIRGVGFLDSDPVVLRVQGMLLPIYSPHRIILLLKYIIYHLRHFTLC